ncbi:MAG: Gfo/Idh/MocA family oxidoreductase [Melioribacteraceae bacterium]|nr:Gfo/Idh/MocA family oxidoreductase [Melioribacteraceae bacterium]
MKKVNIGVIGGGMIGEVHIRTILQDGRANVKWLTTRNKKALKELVTKYSIKNSSNNYKDMLKDPELDAVVVATPPFTHLEIGREVLKANKNLIMEKPLAVNKKELLSFEKLAKSKKDLLVMECSARHARLQPKFQFIKKIIENGEIGEVYHIDHRHLTHGVFVEYNPKGKWALDKTKAGGGPFMDWGVYDLSFHLGLFDDKPELKSVKKFMKTNLRKDIKTDVEQHGAAYLEFSNGLTYYYERGSGVHRETANESVIYGTNGSLRFNLCSWDSNEVEVNIEDKKGKINKKIRKVNMSRHKGDNEVFASHFIDCLLGKTTPLLPIETAIKNMKILFGILN